MKLLEREKKSVKLDKNYVRVQFYTIVCSALDTVHGYKKQQFIENKPTVCCNNKYIATLSGLLYFMSQ